MTLYIYEYSADDVEMDYDFVVAENEIKARKLAHKAIREMGGVNTTIDRLYPLYTTGEYNIQLVKA